MEHNCLAYEEEQDKHSIRFGPKIPKSCNLCKRTICDECNTSYSITQDVCGSCGIQQISRQVDEREDFSMFLSNVLKKKAKIVDLCGDCGISFGIGLAFRKCVKCNKHTCTRCSKACGPDSGLKSVICAKCLEANSSDNGNA